MGRVIEVIYENGVFKPLEKVDLKEGRKIKIEIREEIADIPERFSRRVGKDILLEFIEERR